ncbi:hypothetical protein OG21DRAFT_750312 [Imleria badia]|nr:hypothetical protein OG21DRAFT_750312 [Imleria badia]
MVPIPLPNNPFQHGVFQEAYNQRLALQAEAEASQVAQIEGCPPPIVCARVLGHLLRLAPAGNPRGQVQWDISLAKSHHAQLLQLAVHYVNSFVYTFKRSSGPTLAPSKSLFC